MTEYRLKLQRGIDDLKGQLPEQGTEWWTAEMWKEHYDTLPAKQAWNEQYIAELKANGRYGEEYEIVLSMVPNPVFDSPKLTAHDYPLSSHNFLLVKP